MGRIGQNQYYCWDCSIEFVPTNDGFRLYRLEEDGSTILESQDPVERPPTMTGGIGGSPRGKLKEHIS